MAKRYLLVFISFLIFLSPVQAKIVDKIVAIVDGDVITLSELEEFLGPGRTQMEGVDVKIGNKDVRQRALEQLIERKVLIHEAKDKDIEIREERIDQRIKEIKGRFASEDEFRQALQDEGLTEAKLRKRIEENLMVAVLIDREIKSKIRVGEEEVRKFYEENKEKFKEPGEVEISQIFLEVNKEEGWGESERKGKDLLKQLREGADFSLLAKEYSRGPNAAKGGKLGFLTLGELSPEFEKVVSGLKVGEVSDLIRMGDGFHIIKLEGRKAARQMELAEVKGRIEAIIFADKAEKKYREWIEKLKKKAYIDIR